MSDLSHVKHAPTPDEFLAMQGTQEFAELRSTFRKFAYPMTIAFLAWYLFYIVTATFATDLVNIPVYGAINLGMVLGLAQFVTAGIITWAYVHFADNKLDPLSANIRNAMEQTPTH